MTNSSIQGQIEACHPRIAQALRALASAAKDAPGVPDAHGLVTVRQHSEVAGPVHGPSDFAAALGYSLQRIAKCLLLQCKPAGAEPVRCALACFPASGRLDFRAAAKELNWPRCEVASPSLLQQLLGYAPGGVSPLGSDPLPVIVDLTLLAQPTVLVGAGHPGVEVELPPALLLQATAGRVARILRMESPLQPASEEATATAAS